jgi:tight adherence protein B
MNASLAGIPLIALVLAGGITAVILLIGMAFVTSGNAAQAKRLKTVTGRARGDDDKAEVVLAVRRRRQDGAGLDRLLRRLLPRPELIRLRLERTGLTIRLGNYALACLVLALVTTVVLWRSIGIGIAVAGPIGIVVGLGIPHFLIGRLIVRRRNRFIGQFPEAIDLIVRGLKSGLPVTESFKTVGQEVGDPVGPEFRRICDLLNLGKPMEEALWVAAGSVDSPEFRFFVVSLSVQRETGGNLGETLENLADVLRKRRQTKLKIKALSSEARASAMIIGSLPFVMLAILYVVNVEYISTLFTDPRGHLLLGIGAAWLLVGFGAMAKMVRFEI